MSSHRGQRAFIVEDETLVLFNLEDILSELGCVVVGQAMHLSEAVRLAGNVDEVDFALLDVNLRGEQVFPVAELLRERGIPVIFATGYGAGGLPDAWREHPVIVKPYTHQDVEKALNKLPKAAP